ncbi:MAG: DNA repair protein RecN [Deltaproteobacteria bacterium]|nr:DNA repair protein RecN [Deltaproteobacteria bacterium]
MLHDLSITNFAIIDELHVSFDGGLNIISGETGAGKSILIGAVSLLLGDRATADMIRSQTDTATVEALFNIEDNIPLQEKLAEMGFTADGELVIRRVISRTGKNRAQINGQMATLANLAAISESLINICGQHEHQVILSAENHIDILDEFGGCLESREAYEAVYVRYQQICGEMERLETLRRSRAEKTDLIQFQLAEIRDLSPRADEDIALADEKKVLGNVQKLAGWANRAYALLYDEKGCINDQLKEVLLQIREIQKIDAGLNLPAADMEGSHAVLQEAALTLRDYAKRLVFDPERLAAIDERLDALNRLKRKHGGTLAAVLGRKQEMEEELRRVSGVEEELAGLAKDKDAAAFELRSKARALSGQRRQAAQLLAAAVDTEIRDLNMPHASFSVAFLKPCSEDENSYGPKGGDEIEFYLAANTGEAPKPLQRIASGGELSRIVLALKNVLSRTGSVATIVFDEVDQGIGGATAEIVGRKLKEVSADHQVICITHLPQIASFGGRHLRVAKHISGGRTVTVVDQIDEREKVEEIGRMLGGVDVTDTARDHAREMIAAAGAARNTADTGRSKHAKKSTHR